MSEPNWDQLATKDDINRIMSAIDTYTAEAISYRNRDALRCAAERSWSMKPNFPTMKTALPL